MNTGFLYHAFGLSDLEYTTTAYKDKSIILNVQTSACQLRCPCCGSKHLFMKGEMTMGLLQKAKAAKSVSCTKVVLKKITTEELKNTRIASYGYIL